MMLRWVSKDIIQAAVAAVVTPQLQLESAREGGVGLWTCRVWVRRARPSTHKLSANQDLHLTNNQRLLAQMNLCAATAYDTTATTTAAAAAAAATVGYLARERRPHVDTIHRG